MSLADATPNTGRSRYRVLKKPMPMQLTVDVDEAVRLYADGFTLSDVGVKLGVSAEAVGHRLRREGVAIRNSRDRASSVGTRFWKKILKVPGPLPDPCWEWLGWRNERGYGQATLRTKRYQAHRLAWTITHGNVPPGVLVCHRCDNPPCVNPAHLFLGTPSDNMQDALGKGRWSPQFPPSARKHGEQHPQAKLSAEEVILIRASLARGERGKKLAAHFGVSQSTISAIAKRHIWRHLP